MSNPVLRKRILFSLVLLAAYAGGAMAWTRSPLTGMRPPMEGTPLTQAYVWYDGERQNTVWLDPQVVAEFNPGESGQHAAVKADAGAKELPLRHPQAGIRLWQMNNTGNAAVSGMAGSNPGGKYSPVFHDGPNSNSAMRALPGNVIVQLDPAWSEGKVRAWFGSHQLQMIRKINAGVNVYLIKTSPGMATLEVANALYQGGEVKAAYPDWWQEVVTK